MNTNKTNTILSYLKGILDKESDVTIAIPKVTEPIRVSKSLISLDNMVLTNSSSGRPMYAKSIGSDGFVYGTTLGKIYRSGDSLGTTEEGYNFSSILTDNKVLETVTKTWKGYVVVISDKVAYTSEIWFSDSFTSGFTKVLDVQGRIIQNWTTHFYCKTQFDTVLLAATRKLGMGDPDPLYMSRDGETWTKILETKVVNPNGNSHWHQASYDPYTNRIWAAQGDVENALMWYSDNMGAKWYEIAKEVGVDQRVYQPTVVLPFPNRIILGSDITFNTGISPSLWSLEKDKNHLTDSEEKFKVVHKLSVRKNFNGDTSTQYPTSPFVMNGSEGYIKFGSIGSTKISHIVGTGDGGNTWHHLLGLPDDNSNQSGIVGPDKNGNIYIPYLPVGGSMHHIIVPKIEWIGQ